MKFKMMLKDPDGIYDALEDAAKETGRSMDEITDVTSKYTLYGDYLGVEFDLDAGTVRVLTRQELNDL